MGILIKYDFRKKQKDLRLTVRELNALNQRVSEINEIIDLCSDNDNDVLINLEHELEGIIKSIINSKNAYKTS